MEEEERRDGTNMGTPRKHEILRRAKEIAQERSFTHGLPSITPTEAELKETGVFEEARRELMGTRSAMEGQQMQYIHDVASEVGLKVVDPHEWKAKQRKVRKLQWTVKGYRHQLSKRNPVIPSIPTIDVTRKQRRKTMKKMPTILQLEKQIVAPKPKRKRSHTKRVGKTMRKLRHVNGVKMFSFPDHIWKIKQPRKRRKR